MDYFKYFSLKLYKKILRLYAKNKSYIFSNFLDILNDLNSKALY